MDSERNCKGQPEIPAASEPRTMTGQIVTPKAGQDQGRAFLVIGTAEDGKLLIADGKRRRITRPKKKNPAHVKRLAFPDPGTLAAITENRFSDRTLRAALARYRKQTEKNGEF